MTSYKPSASTFEDWDKEFTASESHFDQWDKEANTHNDNTDIDKIKANHPLLYGLAEKLSKHPKLSSAVDIAANNPVTEAALSSGPALVNAFANMINLPTELTSGKKLVPKMQRPFSEPKNLSGKIGSKIGDLIGAGTAFIASPGSTSIPGALATGFAQGEGGVIPRTLDSLVGLLLPGLLHAGKFGKNIIQAKKASKEISNLDLSKSKAERAVFGAKESLANKLSEELTPIKSNVESFKNALEKTSGSSQAKSKQQVATLLQKTEKDISKKYNNLYEGFNKGEGGQSLVKEPIQIDKLAKEYNLTEKDFSSDSKKLIEKLIGKKIGKEDGSIISSQTGQPINEAKIVFEQAKEPKVSQYIDLWKQLRAEVAEFRNSAKMAQTPEAKRTFRDKANQLEKLSDDVNSRAMNSLSKSHQKEYANIQKGYLHERVPFMEKSILKNAADKFGEVPDNFFDKLNKSGTPELLSTLKKEHPELVHAISTHDLKGVSKMGSNELKELIEGDFGHFVPKNIKDMLKGIHLHKSAQDLLTKALGKVQTSEIGRKARSSDINDIVKKRPDLAKPFENVAKEQERLRKIKEALVDAGFKLKDAEAQLKKFKKAGSLIKAAGTPIGVYAGILKAKGTNFGDNE